jgi:tetratricopeptide (TPR) repeat protein
VLGALVRALDYSGDIDRRARLGDEAVAVARRLNEPETLVHALEGRLKSAVRPENLDQTIADAEEIIRLASVVGDSYMAILGHWWRIDGMLGKGDIAAVDQSIAIGSQMAHERGEPRRIWEALCYQTMRALLSGHYDDAERLAAEALDVGQRPAPRPSWSTYIEHMFVIQREQGRLAELESNLRERVENYGHYPYYHALLTVLLAETGRMDEARESFNWIALQDFRNVPRDLLWLITLALLSEMAHALADVPRARLLYEMLSPCSKRAIVPDAIEVCLGSAAHYIGLLAETIGLDDETRRSYESAIAMNEAMDAAPYLAHSLFAYARWLSRTRLPEDTAHALEMVSRALDIAQAKQMSQLARRCILLQAEIQKYRIA